VPAGTGTAAEKVKSFHAHAVPAFIVTLGTFGMTFGFGDLIDGGSYLPAPVPTSFSSHFGSGKLLGLYAPIYVALGFLIVAHVVPGFIISGLVAALVAAVVIGFVNATLGLVLKVITFPLTLITLGLFWFVINAFMLLFASHVVPGFHVRGFGPAFIGAIVLSLLNMLLRGLFEPKREYERE